MFTILICDFNLHYCLLINLNAQERLRLPRNQWGGIIRSVSYKLFSQTKWPTHPKPPSQNKNTTPSHSEQMSAANKKHYEPLAWDGFFDELSYADDVNIFSSRALLCSEPATRAGYSSVFMAQAILPWVLPCWQRKLNITVPWLPSTSRDMGFRKIKRT